jgi:flagellar biosynthesis/type III secretory pathway chaperone
MTPVQAIISILKEQINSYKMLLDLLRKERTCLIDIDAEKVEEFSKEKDTVLMKLRLLEEERVKLIEKFAEDRGIPGNINLQKLGELTGESIFTNLRSQLKSLLQSIDEMNEFNRILIDRSIRYFKASTSFFSSFSSEPMDKSIGALLSRET